MIGGEKDQAVRPVARLGPIATDATKCSFEGQPRLVPRVPALRRKSDQTKCRVVRDISIRRENVNAFKERRVANDALQNIGDLAAHFGLVIEAALAILHFSAQVCACVEPEARGFLGFVARRVQIMQAVREAIERIRVHGRRLPGLQAAQQDPRAVDSACAHLRRDADLSEARLSVFKLRGFCAIAVNIPFDHGVPPCREIVRKLVTAVAVMQRETRRQDHEVRVVVFPEPIYDFRHQLQDPPRALKAVDGRPVLIETIKHFWMDRISLEQPVVIAAFLRLGGQPDSFGNIGIG